MVEKEDFDLEWEALLEEQRKDEILTHNPPVQLTWNGQDWEDENGGLWYAIQEGNFKPVET